VRVPEGTPFYPGFHHLLSRDWTSDERNPWPDLGEWEGPRQYDSGESLVPEPYARLVGEADCIENGESEDHTPAEMLAGYPILCFATEALQQPIQLQSRAFTLEMARVIADLYADNGNAGPRLEAATGALSSTVFPTAIGNAPAGVICTSDIGTFCVLAGTDNTGDLLLQLFLGIPPPTSFGAYSTLPLWRLAALTYADRLLALNPDNSKPIYFCGHSYGAAVAALLAANYRLGMSDRNVILRTFGMPVAGDARLKTILDTVDRQHIANVGDFVSQVPSSHLAVQLNLITVGALILGLLDKWEFQGNQWLLYDTGELVADDTNNVFNIAFLSEIARSLFDSTPVSGPFTHPIAVYIARLEAGLP